MSFLQTLKNLLPNLSESSTLTQYFQQCYQLEYKNLELLNILIPTIKYDFLADILKDIQKGEQAHCKQIEVEMASNQIDKPALLPNEPERELTMFQIRYHLMNDLLENCKIMSSLYLRISYMDTIARKEYAYQLHLEKEKQVTLLQDVAIRLN